MYCSTGSAYAYQGPRPLREDDPPGVHLGNYSLSKIAGEAVARFAAVDHGVPLTIIRIFSTYGPQGGAPVDRLRRILEGKEIVLHPDAPNNYNPIYEDDYVRLGIRALEVASLDPMVVNWAGSETVSAEEYCAYLGDLVGRPVLFVTTRPPHGRSGPTFPKCTRSSAEPRCPGATGCAASSKPSPHRGRRVAFGRRRVQSTMFPTPDKSQGRPGGIHRADLVVHHPQRKKDAPQRPVGDVGGASGRFLGPGQPQTARREDHGSPRVDPWLDPCHPRIEGKDDIGPASRLAPYDHLRR